MHWTEQYLCPLVERDKFKWNKVGNILKDFFEVMIHALSFHKQPEKPLKELPELKDDNIELSYTVCKEFYKDANDRLDKLEDKAMKLVSYISALFAFISFAFINTQFIATKIILMTSIIFLILAIIISFRCVNVKGRQALFIPDVYNFEGDVPEENFSKKNISKKLLNHAIYNQNIADNTADILRAARYALAVSIIISLIGFFIGLNSYLNTSTKINKVNIENQIELTNIENDLKKTNKSIDELNDNVKNLDDSHKLQDEINELKEELKTVKNEYNELSNKLDNAN